MLLVVGVCGFGVWVSGVLLWRVVGGGRGGGCCGICGWVFRSGF